MMWLIELNASAICSAPKSRVTSPGTSESRKSLCPDQRARNLQYIVNNSRFLILPWVQVKALASTILARSARQVPHDWRQHYGYMPLLLETLVDVTGFNGTCYRAANWIALGETTGRGRMDRHHKTLGTLKRIFVLPLHRRVQQRLCATVPPNVSLTNAD